MLSFAVGSAIYGYEPWLGATFLTLNLGFWCGYGIVGISNVLDSNEFEERKLMPKILSSIGILLIAACGSLGSVLFVLTAIGTISWVIS